MACPNSVSQLRAVIPKLVPIGVLTAMPLMRIPDILATSFASTVSLDNQKFISGEFGWVLKISNKNVLVFVRILAAAFCAN